MLMSIYIPRGEIKEEGVLAGPLFSAARRETPVPMAASVVLGAAKCS